jgi:hypothetical protein
MAILPMLPSALVRYGFPLQRWRSVVEKINIAPKITPHREIKLRDVEAVVDTFEEIHFIATS